MAGTSRPCTVWWLENRGLIHMKSLATMVGAQCETVFHAILHSATAEGNRPASRPELANASHLEATKPFESEDVMRLFSHGNAPARFRQYIRGGHINISTDCSLRHLLLFLKTKTRDNHCEHQRLLVNAVVDLVGLLCSSRGARKSILRGWLCANAADWPTACMGR